MAAPIASVVIPSLNGGSRFRTCLDAVAAQELPGGFEIIVIDSGSDDGSAELAGQYGRVIRIARAEFNHGLTRNRAIGSAAGRAVALLTQDAVPVGKEWLRPLVEAALEPGVAGAYSRQVPRPDCPPFIKARLTRWMAGRTEREVKRLLDEAELMALPVLERIRRLSFDNVSSCLRKEAWEKRPFLERRFGEDAAWAREVLLAGYALVYEPASVVEHSHANSLWYEFKRVYLDHRNWREVAGGALFNNPLEVLQASWNGVGERWQELGEQDVRGAALWYWRAYALPWSFSQNAAQFLGARSMKAARKFKWWERVDDFLARGV
ncbi:MAG TPA: glycosyltransferase family 2 protein [bacterium]|nr:glycosyltransferase family 2 protein [bacterium]